MPTVTPGLINLDPIEGLVNYVSDIKPFHSKIFQVLFEYVYTDFVNTTVTDTLNLFIDDNQTYITSTTDPALVQGAGIPANAFWFNPTTGTLYVRGNYWNPTFRIRTNIIQLSGDYTSLFLTNFAFNISGTGIVNDGDYTVVFSTFDGTYTLITTTPSSVNGTPGTTSFVSPPINPGTFYWNGYQLFIVNGSNQTMIPNVIVQSISPSYGTKAAYWFDPVTNVLSLWNGISYVPVLISAGILGYWNQFITQLSSSPTSTTADTTITEFLETIAFNWGGNYSYPIVFTNLNSNQVSISGNYINALNINDITQIDSTVSAITAIVYDPSTNTTVITMAIVPLSIAVSTITIQDVDITYWYQWPIISVNPSPTAPSQSPLTAARTSTNALVLSINSNVVVPSITVSGNATTSVQVGTLFKVNGSIFNNGVYYAVYVQYEPIANTTTIGVSSTTGVPTPTLTATGGGFIIPYRFITEVPQGSYDDNSGYDTGNYDQSAGSEIYQGP